MKTFLGYLLAWLLTSCRVTHLGQTRITIETLDDADCRMVRYQLCEEARNPGAGVHVTNTPGEFEIAGIQVRVVSRETVDAETRQISLRLLA